MLLYEILDSFGVFTSLWGFPLVMKVFVKKKENLDQTRQHDNAFMKQYILFIGSQQYNNVHYLIAISKDFSQP